MAFLLPVTVRVSVSSILGVGGASALIQVNRGRCRANPPG